MAEKHLMKGVRSSLESFAQYENVSVYPLCAISNFMVEAKNQLNSLVNRMKSSCASVHQSK